MDVDTTNENQRPQADTRAEDDEFNLANYDEEGEKLIQYCEINIF